MSLLDHLLAMFKSDILPHAELKRLVRYFYDPPPKFDEESGSSTWLLGKEYKSSSPQPITTTDCEDVVEIESSADSHNPSEATGSTTEDTNHSNYGKEDQTRDSIDDVQKIEGQNLPSLSNDPADGGWPLAFVDDFESRIWMTYRSNFPPISRSQSTSGSSNMSFTQRLRSLAEGNSFSSDTGWGCMIRSGQSLLANALLTLHLGRDWRYHDQGAQAKTLNSQSTNSLDSEAAILSLFADSPSAPFSIHRFVNHGATSCSTHPGQWFGPSATASCISALTPQYPLAGLRIYSTPSTDVYEDKFRTIAAASPTDSTITPTLILLGIRLGLDRITPVYHEALKRSLTYPQSIGIAGGRPSSSHYFIGIHNETFFYLDPHETRPALPYHSSPGEYTAEDIATCHTRRLRGLRIADMDPSMLMSFLIKDEADWQDWKRRLNEVPGKKIVNVYAREPPVPGVTVEREEAVDEVQTFDDEEDAEGDNQTEKGD